MNRFLFAACITALMVSHAHGAPTHPVAKAIAVEKRFEGRGRVLLFQGQPCAPQIMFELRQGFPKSTIHLAAPLRESRVLSDFARHRQTVRVSGVWRHWRDKLCRYVEVTRVVAD